MPSQLELSYDGQRQVSLTAPYNAWSQVDWQGHRLELITIGIQASHCRTLRHFVLGPDSETLDQFFCTVCKWNSEVRGEVLVYHGQWYKDERLFQDIRSTTLDGLILKTEFKAGLVREFSSFFESRDLYERHGVAWKRGVLLLGAPGNGKTHAIKGLVNLVAKPALYVKSFKHQYQTDHQCIGEVFARARESAPCVLVLEDLDSLLDDGNRSFFLNEMDGFAANSGILTVATTNHPERLDPAILERPSRFDRKYAFDLPGMDLRISYLQLQNRPLEPVLQMSESEVTRLAELTDGFSYAYLKELVLSGLMLWIERSGDARMAELMATQVETLLDQMRTAPMEPVFGPDEEGENPFAYAMSLMRRHHR